MIKPIDKRPAWAALLLIFACAISRAEVTATIDREIVTLGDTLRLTISATKKEEDLSNVTLEPLLRDFEVLQRSNSSNTSLVNGKLSHNRKLIVEIAPRREGALVIPPLQVGAKNTRAIPVVVSAANPVAPGDATVVFEAEIDRTSVFVQGQILLTLRLQQAVNLDSRSISELELDNAFVIPLEQSSFQRTIDGRNWLVHEVRYAIFPEQSGTLHIPAQSFSAREGQVRRSFSRGGKLIRRQSQPLSINVLPKPASYSGGTWLPARNIEIEESWSKSPQQLKVGESVTRTIVVRGEGLQGAQLPPLPTPTADGAKFYPDQPSINDAEISTGLLGSRKDSVAIVPTRAGSLTLPEIRIAWWDTQAKTLRYASLSAREVQVGAAQTDTSNIPPPEPSQTDPASATVNPPSGDESGWLWRLLAFVSTAGWIATVVYIFVSQRTRPLPTTTGAAPNVSERKTFNQLLAVCAANSAAATRAALLNWVNTLGTETALVSLQQVSDWFADDALSNEIQRLDSALFSGNGSEAQCQGSGTPWHGGDLATTLKRLRKENQSKPSSTDEPLALYS